MGFGFIRGKHFFLVVLTMVSLLSYTPTDPSINHAKASGEVQNLFGLVGAHISGFLSPWCEQIMDIVFKGLG